MINLRPYAARAATTALSWSEKNEPQEHGYDRAVIVHIPKTAGTWLRAQLVPHYPEDRITPVALPGDLPSGASGFNKYSLISTHLGYDLASQIDANLITTLREPVERVISLYHFWREHPVTDHGPGFAKRYSFEGFLDARDEPAVLCGIVNQQAWQIIADNSPHTRTSERFRNMSNQALLDTAKRHLNRFTVVGLTEDLPRLAQDIKANLGICIDASASRMNVTSARPQKSEIGQRVLNKAAEAVELDTLLYEWVRERLYEREASTQTLSSPVRHHHRLAS